uniref:Neprosin PEP catalytic domain-containing protein n=1 Tax=Aegilops tauschii TaxID=37682 RepID=M8BWM7_AEGTA
MEMDTSVMIILVFSWNTSKTAQMNEKISPSLYNNRDIRFFTYWTKDLKSKGCYNSQCAGYVPASGAELVPGQAIAPPSVYGIQDHYIRLSINKNAHGPPMGSGHFPDYDEKKSTYFNHIKKYNSKGQAFDPFSTKVAKLVDRPDCYDANDLFLEFKKGYTFNYGGPSGCIG